MLTCIVHSQKKTRYTSFIFNMRTLASWERWGEGNSCILKCNVPCFFPKTSSLSIFKHCRPQTNRKDSQLVHSRRREGNARGQNQERQRGIQGNRNEEWQIAAVKLWERKLGAKLQAMCMEGQGLRGIREGGASWKKRGRRVYVTRMEKKGREATLNCFQTLKR